MTVMEGEKQENIRSSSKPITDICSGMEIPRSFNREIPPRQRSKEQKKTAHLLFTSLFVYELVIGAILYVLTWFMLRKKLNLQ